jgi:F-type H+-transporting ATPase subunit alpha
MPVEEQVVAIFAGVRGFLDSIPVSKIGEFERQLLSAIRDKHGDILEEIRTSQALSDELSNKLAEVIGAFAKSFVA